MRAILIAPDQEVIVQTLDIKDGIQAIKEQLDCSLFDCIRLDEFGNTMYVDDEGMSTKDYFFRFGQYPSPIAGRGLILGADMTTGESQDTDINFNLIAAAVEPLTPAEAYQMAKEADREARQQIKDSGQEANTIFISTSEIMESAWYADQLGIE